MNTTGWLKGLQATAEGTGIVSHAGVAGGQPRPDHDPSSWSSPPASPSSHPGIGDHSHDCSPYRAQPLIRW